MEAIFEIFNQLPTPYSDLAAVTVLFAVIAVIGLIISYLFEQKAPDQIPEDTVEKEPTPPPEIEEPLDDPFVSAAEPTGEEIATPEVEAELVAEALESTPAPEPEVTTQPETTVEEPLSSGFSTPTATEEIAAESTEVTEQVMVEPPAQEPVMIEKEIDESKQGLFARLRSGLSKTHTGFIGKLNTIMMRSEINEELWEDFEEALITADLGMGTTMKLRDAVEQNLDKQNLKEPGSIKDSLKQEILNILKNAQGSPIEPSQKPFVVMVAGVNGVGKTTTIGKLAHRFRKNDHSVMVAAGDTFRAAALEQLEVWSKRVGSDFIKGQSGADPSAVAFDAIKASQSRGTDVLIIDTAGRLHTKGNLMDELKKMRRVIGREYEGAPHEILLVLDATTGQNAVQQAKMFNESIDVTGIVLTKLDGTAKGGVIVAIADELNIPVKYIGIGESLGDLREFDAEEFTEALFMSDDETIH